MHHSLKKRPKISHKTSGALLQELAQTFSKSGSGWLVVVMFTQETISIPLNCLHCKNRGSRFTAAFSLLLIMWACNKPIKPIDTDERQHIILSKKLVNCIPSADCDQALISYLLQLKSHYSSFSSNRVRWIEDGECSEFSNCSDLSRKKLAAPST